MNRYLKSRWTRILVALVLITLVGILAVDTLQGARDKFEVAKMTEKMKTVCVGRFLIDMPEHAHVSLSGPVVDGFNIEAHGEDADAFKARVAAREAEIRAKPDRLGGDKNMESAKAIQTDHLAGKIFVFGREVTAGMAGAKGDKPYHYENVAVEGYVHGNGVSVDFVAEAYDPDRLENLPKLIAQLRLTPDNKPPTEPGFCFDGGYFRDPLTADQGERVTLFAKLPGHPDLAIVFDSIAGLKPHDGLLARNAKANDSESPGALARVTRLNAEKRVINGIPGEQVLERVDEVNFSTVFALNWESVFSRDDVRKPKLSLELQTGVSSQPGGAPVQSSLSQDALLMLWDRISSSIRARSSGSALSSR